MLDRTLTPHLSILYNLQSDWSPKAGGQTHLIFHLSYDFLQHKSVNFYTPESSCSVKYQDLDQAVRQALYLIKHASDGKITIWFAKSDLKSAFRILGLHPSMWWLLVLKAQDPRTGKWEYFVDKCLPFGHSISCALFQAFSDALVHIHRFIMTVRVNDQTKSTNYLDDFLFLALRKLWCQMAVERFLELCRDLKVPVSSDKTEWPTVVIVFLGILLNGEFHYLAIPEEKRLKAVHLLRSVVDRRKTTVKELQRLAGFLNFLNKAIVPGRAFTRRMYSKFAGVTDLQGNPNRKSQLKPHHHLRIDKELKDDCRMWIEFLQSSHKSAYYRPFIDFNQICCAKQLRFFTDAAKGQNLGFGGIFNKHWIVGQWEPDFIKQEDPSIEFLELYGVVIAVFAWHQELVNKRIILFCDNQSVVAMLNSSSSSCKFCMKLIRMLTLKSLKHNFRVFARWIRGSLNTESDLLSRQKISTFKEVTNNQMDLFPVKLPTELWPLSRLWHQFKST